MCVYMIKCSNFVLVLLTNFIKINMIDDVRNSKFKCTFQRHGESVLSSDDDDVSLFTTIFVFIVRFSSVSY